MGLSDSAACNSQPASTHPRTRVELRGEALREHAGLGGSEGSDEGGGADEPDHEDQVPKLCAWVEGWMCVDGGLVVHVCMRIIGMHASKQCMYAYADHLEPKHKRSSLPLTSTSPTSHRHSPSLRATMASRAAVAPTNATT